MRRTPTQRRRWPAGRGGARRGLAFLLVAIALLLAQGSRLGHMLLIQHSVCEHGDLVEGEHHAEAASSSLDPSDKTLDPSDKTAADATGSDYDGDHDHCDAPAILHRVDLTTATIACASLSYVEPAGGAERAEVRAVSPIDLAPKAWAGVRQRR
jgi:hypothetical protein